MFYVGETLLVLGLAYFIVCADMSWWILVMYVVMLDHLLVLESVSG